MNEEQLHTAGALALRTGSVYVATASAKGVPHLAVAGMLAIDPGGRAIVTEWFCPGTVSNLQANPLVALVIWDPETDEGYQLLGRVTDVNDLSVLDGYAATDFEPHMPQVERELVIQIAEVLTFSQGPHTDVAE